MDEEGESILLEENYYQLLNVSKTATTEEINSAYRRFSRMFHPDKHSTDPNKQKWAEQIFGKIKEAYEVLSDSHKRAIYDTLGKRGLEVDGWEIIFRTRTPREIREEYERLKREREERRLQQSANPRGTITLSINATDLFMKYYDEYELLEDTTIIPSIEVSGMSIQQSIDVPVTLRNTSTLSGNISTQNGIGTGAVTVSNRHLSSERGWTEVECGIGNGPIVGFKMFRTISRLMFLNFGTGLQFTSRGIVPNFVSTMAMQLDAHSVGYLTYRAGGQGGSSMTSTYARDSEKYHLNSAVQIGSPHSFISLNIMRKLPNHDMKLRLAFKVGTFGAIAEYGAEKKVSQSSSVSAAVMLGVPSGVMLKLKWSCSTQSIVVPIHLCEEVIPSAVFYATTVPLVSWLLLKKLLLDPIARERTEREKRRSMEANFERLQEMQRQARATIELMKETYSRIRNDEDKKKGLVIIRALYGRLPAGASAHDVDTEADGDASPMGPVEVIDVTIPVQCLTRDSRLELLEASKSELSGFYDPCVGEDKHLTVKYSYHGNLHVCTVPDNQPLVLPRNSAASKYILEEYEVECVYPDIGHCPVKCMSRSYAHLFLRFQNLEDSMREMRCTLDTVLDYVIRDAKSDTFKKKSKKGKKSRGGSRSGSEVDQDLLDAQAILERDFALLATLKNSGDERSKPKKPRCEAIRVYLKTGISSSEQSSGDEQPSEADDVVRKVSQVIDDMAKVANEIQATAEITSDVAELQSAGEENDEPDYAEDFFALYNEMNELD